MMTYASTDDSCAVILAPYTDVTVEAKGVGQGFAWIYSRGTRVYSCYTSRNGSEEKFAAFFSDLKSSFLQSNSRWDFNTWSSEWGLLRNDARGERLADVMVSLISVNTGKTPTYQRCDAETIIDVMFTRIRTPNMVNQWRVFDKVESGSDHKYIEFKFSYTIDDEDAENTQPR